ncbi:aspartyl-tRNA(Asn)/glutamyl-tRNA(Gln) amidotransferase subunit A [Stella humosa]|uniref:Aspartyl-tRNA(Asn)/glutamyl-tRNA(Gln) amidotransferase subunit A n=1 Tax=Stella humosa TaxID=94 RepID=A0A3N1KQQ3_9PROT|nr:amidase [Stella humosa]ROP81119.1 aspartyl-tRNA(Asn)/glutamyl-tRNA(Gln) amidotransferase subunit A [Stella humosa]BBK32464.1 amidase [Stella humosa]
MFQMRPIADLAADLAAGRTTSAELTEAALARIADPAGEGAATFMVVHADAARAAAEASDRLRAAGVVPSPLAGIPVSVKDLFDEQGQVTRAGSTALAGAPATADAPIVARLRAAGAVIVGRTNMVEFAFSGVGLNPHYGTPAAPFERATNRRVPGGSSSGAAVSVSDGMAAVAIGSDTGGSVRIPSAFCGLAGLKPTASRVPTAGAFPLSTTLDSVGPLAPTLACCAVVDAIMAGEAPTVPAAAPLAGLRLGLPRNIVRDGIEAVVADHFDAALKRLSAAGAHIVEFDFPELDEIPVANSKGGFAVAEAWALHRQRIAERGQQFDPRVRVRIERGVQMEAADYVDLIHTRANINRRADARTAVFDAVIMPTCVVLPPPIANFTDDGYYGRTNLLILRNTALGNFLDRCSVSIPATPAGAPPVGFCLVGQRGDDRRLLSVGRAVEALLAA